MLMTYCLHERDLKRHLKDLGNTQDVVDANLVPALSDSDINDYVVYITEYPLWMKYFILAILHVEGDNK